MKSGAVHLFELVFFHVSNCSTVRDFSHFSQDIYCLMTFAVKVGNVDYQLR